MLDRKAEFGEELSDYELQCGDLLAHFEKSLRTSVAMEEANGGYSANGYNAPMMHMRGMSRGMSYDDGMSYADRQPRDGMGRYSSEGYSRADGIRELARAMNGAMGEMPEDLRREAQRFLDKMNQRM